MTNNVRAVLLDLEGTLYANGRALPGASAVLSWLRARPLGLRLLTNTDSLPPAAIATRLGELGLAVSPGELVTPLVAARRLLADARGARAHLLVSAALRETLELWALGPPYTHVVVGDCRDVLDYARLDDAFRALRAGAELVALQRGRYFKRDDGDHIDTGAVVAGLEYAAGVTARVVGKPSIDFFATAAAAVGVPIELCLVVGDDATTDVAGGRAARAQTVQVRTGKFADQVVEGLDGGADYVIGSIADLPDLLREAGA